MRTVPGSDVNLLLALGHISRSQQDLEVVKDVMELLSAHASAEKEPWTFGKLSRESDAYLVNHCRISPKQLAVIRRLSAKAATMTIQIRAKDSPGSIEYK